MLISPLHQPAPTHPIEPSPYYPSTRRFGNPLHLRIEEIPAPQRLAPYGLALIVLNSADEPGAGFLW